MDDGNEKKKAYYSEIRGNIVHSTPKIGRQIIEQKDEHPICEILTVGVP